MQAALLPCLQRERAGAWLQARADGCARGRGVLKGPLRPWPLPEEWEGGWGKRARPGEGKAGQPRASLTSLPLLPVPKGSGDSSLEKEFSSAIVGPAVSTPNSQHSSPSRSLSGEYAGPAASSPWCPQA